MMKRFLTFGILGAVLGLMPVAAHAQEDTLCPSVEELKSKAPDALTGVQSDIDRLTLCIERTRLLKQLDDIVDQRKKMLSEMGSDSGAMPSMGVGGIPVLPAGSLPPVVGIDTKNLKPGETRIQMPVGAAFDQAAPARSAPSSSDWKVRKIWGQGNAIRAQLTDGNGVLVNAVKGDPLPDGAVVETLSVKGVTISRNGKVSDLSWEQVTDPNAPQTAP